MNKLYPIKFKPIYKDKIWGGQKIKTVLNKNFGDLPNCGESWEISGVQENLSVVENGFLAGNNIEELIEIYMGDLVGEKVFERFGNEFPLLIKFIDANQFLSIQVHPDDAVAKQRHNAYGKTEMWYVLQADEGAQLISGFNRKTNKEEFLKRVNTKSLVEILNAEKVNEGDVFFLPAGRVHAIGPGLLLAEIQQTSDITYRVYDYDRLDDEGKPRDLHIDLAVDVINYEFEGEYKTNYEISQNNSSNIIECEYFKTNILNLDKEKTMDYSMLDSFVIYMCVEGSLSVGYNDSESIALKKGETILIPAELNQLTLKPESESKILEVYISK